MNNVVRDRIRPIHAILHPKGTNKQTNKNYTKPSTANSVQYCSKTFFRYRLDVTLCGQRKGKIRELTPLVSFVIIIMRCLTLFRYLMVKQPYTALTPVHANKCVGMRTERRFFCLGWGRQMFTSDVGETFMTSK